VGKRSLGLQDLSIGENPVTTLDQLGRKLIEAKEFEEKAASLKLSEIGNSKLGSCSTLQERKTLVDDLERIKTQWIEQKKTVETAMQKYFNEVSDIKKTQPELWKSATKEAPTAIGFQKLLKDGDVRAAGDYVAQLSGWWLRTKTAAEKNNWLRSEYGSGWEQQDAEERSKLCMIAMQIGVLQQRFADAMKACDENLKERRRNSGQKKDYTEKQGTFRSRFGRELGAWQKPRNYLYEWIEAGEQAINNLGVIITEAEDFADSDEFVSQRPPQQPQQPQQVDPIWERVVEDCSRKWRDFCDTGNARDRLAIRGVFPPAGASDYLFATFQLGTRVKIGTRRYVVKESFTSRLAFHTEIPAPLLFSWRPDVQDFIYHFR